MTTSSSLASFCSARTDGCSLDRLGQLEPFRILLGREIDALEQLGRRARFARRACAASRTKPSILAMLAAMSGPKDDWMAATVSVRSVITRVPAG